LAVDTKPSQCKGFSQSNNLVKAVVPKSHLKLVGRPVSLFYCFPDYVIEAVNLVVSAGGVAETVQRSNKSESIHLKSKRLTKDIKHLFLNNKNLRLCSP